MIAEVIVDLTNSEVDKVFEYKFDDPNLCEGCRVNVPFGSKIIQGIIIRVKNLSDYPIDKLKSIISFVDDSPVLTKETLALTDFICKTCYVTKASALRLFLPSEMRKGKVREKFVSYVYANDLLNVDETLNSFNKSAIKQKDFFLYINEVKKAKLSELNNLFGNQAVKSVINKGLVTVIEEKDFRLPYKNLEAKYSEKILTNNQENAYKNILETDKTTTLLYGVTGSGKTEIYLKLISDVIRNGKTAIMLVPEIALTPQMLKQLRARFGEDAAILHSGLSAGERFDEWWRLRTGEAKIAIGARSAIFAPVSNLGLIIIDEEHDGSYTSESSPRYDTLDVAKFRAEYNGAKIVLGSATPKISSFLNAENGIYNLVTLRERVNKKPLPKIEIVDMKVETRRGNSSPFSSALKEEIENCLSSKNQVMLFLNQRGYSKTVICTECGHVFKCDACDVSLTYHYEEDALLCHYCGAKYKMVEACTECGSKFIRYGGYGTERVVLELKKLFPNAKILRMDRDTTQNKESHFEIVNDFAQKKADILVGTQMIAKGHDFSDVTLVGILDADMSLHFSDYRSSERTFELLTQVSGRSGRADKAGKVILQTYNPDNFILKFAVNYDYDGFYKHEVSVRKATGFPPFYDIVRVLISGENEETSILATKTIYKELSNVYNDNKNKFRFFGCMKAPIKKIQNKYRYQILMRINTDDRSLLDTIYYTSIKYNNKGVSVYMEVNPNNLS